VLFAGLGTARGPDLQAALAKTLGDPGLVVLRWEDGRWAGADGRPVPLPEPDEDRRVARVASEGRPLAAIVYESSLDDDPELIEAATAAAAIALQLRLLQNRVGDDPSAAALVTTASDELARSLEELRELARGLHPAVLEHGLGAALQSLASRSPVATTVAYEAGEALPESVELAAYYVASEALTNVAKYSGATNATVRVSRDASYARIEIADDGIGGADEGRGTGLRGLADRVEALDGRLRVSSPAGAGTTVSAELPCVS
jgi:signal transduction histidine kinase